MTGEERVFTVAFLISLGVHAVFTGVFFTLPTQKPEEAIPIYTVRIVEAPVRPEARELTISTRAISALNLQGPSLNLQRPPSALSVPPKSPGMEKLPKGLPAPEAMLPPKAPLGLKPLTESRPPALPALPTGKARTPRRDFRVPEQDGVKPRPKAALPGATSRFPNLPTPPQPPPLPPATGKTPALPQATGLRPPALPPHPREVDAARESPIKRPIDRARERVQALKLEVKFIAPTKSTTSEPRERNLLSLRRYSKAVGRAVQKNYSFPGSGGFKSTLRARVRLSHDRNGQVQEVEVLESSGNKIFDQVVCRSRLFNTKFPPAPDDVPDDPLVWLFTCKP